MFINFEQLHDDFPRELPEPGRDLKRQNPNDRLLGEADSGIYRAMGPNREIVGQLGF